MSAGSSWGSFASAAGYGASLRSRLRHNRDGIRGVVSNGNRERGGGIRGESKFVSGVVRKNQGVAGTKAGDSRTDRKGAGGAATTAAGAGRRHAAARRQEKCKQE